MSATDASIRSVPVPPAWLWAVAAAVAGLLIGLAEPLGSRPEMAVVALVGLTVASAIIIWPRFGLLAIAASLPLDVAGRIVEQPVTVTVFHVLLLLTLVSWGIRAAREPRSWVRPSLVDVGMAGLVAAALWSLPNSLAPGSTVFAIVRLVFLWLFVLAYQSLATDRPTVERLLDVVVATGFLTGLLTIAQFVVPDIAPASSGDLISVDGARVARVSGFFDDPNYLAGFLAIVVIVALARLVHAKRPLPALLYAVGGATAAAGLLLTYSRTGWVGALIGAVIVLATAPARRRGWLAAAALALVVAGVAVAPGAVASRFESITDTRGDRSASTRVLMAQSTLEMIGDGWVWGTGLNAFDRAYPRYREPGSDWRIIRPHQIPLSVVAETGILGLIAQLMLVWAVARQFVRRRAGPLTDLEAVALAGIVSLLLQSFFQYYLYFEYLWLFVALSVVVRRLAQAEEGSRV